MGHPRFSVQNFASLPVAGSDRDSDEFTRTRGSFKVAFQVGAAVAPDSDGAPFRGLGLMVLDSAGGLGRSGL